MPSQKEEVEAERENKPTSECQENNRGGRELIAPAMSVMQPDSSAKVQPIIQHDPLMFDPPFQFMSTKKSKVAGNDRLGGVAKRPPRTPYRSFVRQRPDVRSF